MIHKFMYIYMFQLENLLNHHKESFTNIQFQSDEANTDKEIKSAIKKFILEHQKELLNSNLKLDLKNQLFEFKDIQLKNIYLQDDLNAEIKEKLELSKNPDILLEFLINNQTEFIQLEIKSTKDNKIPGSSIQQILPYEWVLFIKRSKNQVDFTAGQYIHAITEKIQFPDRSPRPEVAYNHLVAWNHQYRTFNQEKNILTIQNLSNFNDYKILSILEDWENHLALEWLERIKLEKNTKWFDNAMFKFSKHFLNYYDSLSSEEQVKFKKLLENSIKEDF